RVRDVVFVKRVEPVRIATAEDGPDRAPVADHQGRQRADAADVLQRRPDATGVLLERLAAREAESGAGAQPAGVAVRIVAGDIAEQSALPIPAVAFAQPLIRARREPYALAHDPRGLGRAG